MFDNEFMTEQLYLVLKEHGMGSSEDFQYRVNFEKDSNDTLIVTIEYDEDMIDIFRLKIAKI